MNAHNASEGDVLAVAKNGLRENHMTAIADTGPGQLIRCALSRLCGGRPWRDDGRDCEPRSLVPQFRPRHLRRATDRHRPVHGIRDRADPAQSRPVRAP